MARELSPERMEHPLFHRKKQLAIIGVVIAAGLATGVGTLLDLSGAPSFDISTQLENASIFVGDLTIELRHVGGDNVNLSDLRVVVSDNVYSIGISGNDLTVFPESDKFGPNSVLTARRQAPFENGSVVTIKLIYQPTGETLDIMSGVVLSEIVNPSIVKIEGYQLLVNGEPFVIKGVSYSPTPVGKSSGYAWWGNSGIYQHDFPMIREMGANTIRTYDATKATKESLDAAYRNNLHVIMGYWVNHNLDFSNSALRQATENQFIEMVQKWKDHPAVLMWGFGNEVGMNTSYKQGWYTLVQEAAQAAHTVDPNHPVIVVEGDRLSDIGNTELGSDDDSLSALDLWGINSYRGSSFGGLFSEYQSKTNKPLVLTEWGCDALNIKTMVEDQDTQASYVGSLWSEIESHLGAVGGRCLGGTVFEWSDEWWKSGNILVHDKIGTGDWANPSYYDYVAGKNNMNEEWWGITSVSSGTYEKTTRDAYYILKDLWTENVAIGFTLIPSPASGSAIPGGSIDLTLYVLPSGGYSEFVSLTASDLPPGITVTFENESGVPPFTSTLEIAVGTEVDSGTYQLTIVGTGADEKTATCTYQLEVGMFVDQVMYSDSVLPPSGAVIWVWSGADWGGPAGTFENSYLGETPPEGSKCFRTTSGANWNDNANVNYAGWGIFYADPSDHTIDLSDYNYLKFWVKSPEDLKIEIQTGGRHGGKYTTYLSQHGWDGTNTWQEIAIPKGTFEMADFSQVYGPFMATVVGPSITFHIDNVRWSS